MKGRRINQSRLSLMGAHLSPLLLIAIIFSIFNMKCNALNKVYEHEQVIEISLDRREVDGPSRLLRILGDTNGKLHISPKFIQKLSFSPNQSLTAYFRLKPQRQKSSRFSRGTPFKLQKCSILWLSVSGDTRATVFSHIWHWLFCNFAIRVTRIYSGCGFLTLIVRLTNVQERDLMKQLRLHIDKLRF